MIEDDYTGHSFDDLDDLELAEEDLIDWDEDVEFDDELDLDAETVVNVIDVVEGAKSLQDIAERLYDYADEMLSLAALGWELMDDVTGGQGVALMLGDEDDDVDDAEAS